MAQKQFRFKSIQIDSYGIQCHFIKNNLITTMYLLHFITSVILLQKLCNPLSVAGQTIHTVINANWEPVIRDIAPLAFEQIIKACVEEAKKLFAAVPAHMLLLP